MKGAVWLLAVGQTLTYAAIYYSFAALLPELELAYGWSKAQLAAGPTLAFLVTAALTPLTGRLVDQGWGGRLLVGLPVLGAGALAALASVSQHATWLAVWAVIGVAQAGCLYETCFAFLTRHLKDDARAAITRVTLVAGLASTLAFPLGAALGGYFGGRGALLAFAVLMLLGAVPANLAGVRWLSHSVGAGMRGADTAPGAMAAALRRPAFWGIAAIFGLIWLNHSVVMTYALTLFADRGATGGMAVIAAATVGPAQVLGRLALMMNEARIGNARATLFALAAVAAASGMLALAGMAPWLIFGFALMQGAGAGLLSILRPVLLAEKLGRNGFGAVSGAVAVAPILATAAGPSVGAQLLATGGPPLVYGSCLAMALAALIVGCVLVRPRSG